jgi:hypothetical protein
MYIIQNGQIIRPQPPSAPPSAREELLPPHKRIFRACKQVVLVMIILFFIYMFTCGKCKDVFAKLFK